MHIPVRLWAALVVLALGLLYALGPFVNAAPASAPAPTMPKNAPFDCSQIARLGIDRMMNFHAAEILAGCRGTKSPDRPGPVSPAFPFKSLRPDNYGGDDRNVILPDHPIYPKITQSESMVWGHGNTIVVNYNDSRNAPGCYAGISYSTDGGTTWTRPGGADASPLCSGHGTNYGDPVVAWNNALDLWFAGDLAGGCGGATGIGLWTSLDGVTWTAAACAHNGSGQGDDRPSMWVDNNPGSPHYGRMYISWNDYSQSGTPLYVMYSDNGTTWTPVRLQVGTTFVRDVQITGSPGTDGTVYVAGMNEGGGGTGNRTNLIYRSTNGGAAWTAITMGAAFAPPGDGPCGSSYFRMITPIWRHMGWGQPAVGPDGVVHYVYSAAGAGADHADILYVRSTDSGTTWSTPLRLNTDSTARSQWEPSLAATSQGALVASWYDRRNTTNNDYEFYGRVSTDNGASWGTPDHAISDQIITQPLQPDAAVQPCYAGDYNYHSADGTNAYVTWTDGRNLINGNPQQDVYFDKIDLQAVSPSPTPTACPTCTATFTSTPAFTPTGTATYTRTNTPTSTRTSTFTGTPGATSSPSNTATETPISTSVTTNTSTPTATVTQCALNFSDVYPTDYFYEAVRYLYCRGVVSGYGDNTFRPGSVTTRGQLCKIVTLAEGWTIYTPLISTFGDVPPNHTFYQYIETAYHQGIISGYSCGAGCLEFHPGDNVTRGQLCKIVVLAEGWTLQNPPDPTFTDVPTTDAFYRHIETADSHGIISGYSCGAGCLEFRPGGNATRGQICKIVYAAITQP